MILYQYPGGDGLSSISPPCMKVEMALRLVGAEFRVENLFSPTAVRRVSVTGRLPVVDFDGELVPDSMDILDRLERRLPEARLWPRDARRRLVDRLWDHFGTECMYWNGFYLRWMHPDSSRRFYHALFGRMSLPARLGVRWTFLPRQRRRARLQGVGGKSPAAIREAMERGLSMVVQGLEGGPFLQGRSHPGRGDLACAALLVQAGFRDSMPETQEQIRGRAELPAHARRVLEACGMKRPAWLES